MILKNFRLADDYLAIETEEDGYLDLQNNFFLSGFRYDFVKRYFEITWVRSEAEWVPGYNFDSFKLKFRNVEILRMKEAESEKRSSFQQEDLCISEIGYTLKEDKEFLGVLDIDSVSTKENFAITLSTLSGQSIIIFCEEAEFEKAGSVAAQQ